MGTANKKSKSAASKSKGKEPMRKAASAKEKIEKSNPAAVKTTSSPTTLGTKRTCPKCSAKFYDFAKEELNCPKCNTKLKASDFKSLLSVPLAEPKKAKPVEKVTPEAVLAGEEETTTSDDTFESVEDLADAEDNVVDIEVENEGDDY